MRKGAGTVIEEHYHFSLHEVAHVALLVDTPRVEPSPSTGCRPTRNEYHVDGLLQVHDSLLIVTVALDNRHEPPMRNALKREVLQDIMIPDKLCLLHQVARIGLICLLAPEELLLAYTQVCMVREIETGALPPVVRIEQFLKVFLLLCQLLVHIKVG